MSRAYTPRSQQAHAVTPAMEEVAIVGVSMALPGDVNNLDDMWNVLSNHSSTLSPARDHGALLKDNLASFLPRIMSAHRLSQTQVDLATNPNASLYSKNGSMNEAEFQSMHLAHKLVLYHARKALIDAGYAADSVPSYTGVYVGVMGNLSPSPRFFDAAGNDVTNDTTSAGAFAATSHNLSVIAGRVSFALNLRGPSMAIDTACSSALVALHTARRALQLRECDVAIVAGVNVIEEDTSLAVAMAHMLSSDGLCRSFDSAGDGYGRGEGCGVIVLKRMSDCRENNQKIYGVVKGSAVQQDGTSASLTAPNPIAQEMVLKQALSDAKLTANQVSFFECHGTGTVYGDPVEVQAIAKVYKEHAQPLPISASKSVFGHLEAAAGLVGLFSVLLTFQHRVVPGIANLNSINPIVKDAMKNTTLSISNESCTLSSEAGEEGVSVGGVSSFGYSGTLAHVIVQEPPRINASLALNSDIDVGSASTAAKQPMTANGFNAAIHEYLNDTITDTPTATEQEWMKDVVVIEGSVWQFSGQGSLVVNAGKALYDNNDIFRANLRRCDAVLKKQLGITAEELLYPKNLTPEKAKERLTSHTAHSQAVLIALEIALCLTLIQETNTLPSAVMGHSLGEYAAMVCTGYWSPEQALNVVCGRGLAVHNNSQACKGVMHALRASPEDVQDVIDLRQVRHSVATAAINGDMSLVISGNDFDVSKVVAVLKERGTISASIPLPVSHAFHSPLLKAAVPSFLAALQPVIAGTQKHAAPWAGKVKFISTLRGVEVARSELQSSAYWEQHMLQAVRYRDAVKYCALTLKITSLLEIGPQGVLTKLAMPIVSGVSKQERWVDEQGGRTCEISFCLD
jgi:acyl transferase domain-containing protein